MSASEAQSEGITMSGGGLYSLATTGAKHVIDAATPLVLNAISTLPLESIERGFTISDMGCIDAGGINMFDTFNQIWRSFLDQKRINTQEYENMTLP